MDKAAVTDHHSVRPEQWNPCFPLSKRPHVKSQLPEADSLLTDEFFSLPEAHSVSSFLIRPFTYLPFIISVKSYALIHFEIRVSTYELQSKQSSPFPLWIRQEHRQASLQAGHSMHSSSLPCYAEHDPSIPQSLSREPPGTGKQFIHR